MKKKAFDKAPCSIARAVDVLGDKWNPLILRECLYGMTRFDGIQSSLGMGRNILTDRLQFLVAEGLLARKPYGDRADRVDYVLTEKGYDAAQALLAFMTFSERHFFPAGEPPIRLFDRTTGRPIQPRLVDANSGNPVDVRDLVAGPGPAFPKNEKKRKERFSEFYALGFGDGAS